ncbi:MAG: DinB family protein, partial [Candidatus Rokubacteria bacterium]|nr:DinB family protein [Candidatus Rokubacteria bacterium]
AEHLAWLQRHGETVGDASPIEVEVTEEVEARREAEFCFAADHVPVTVAEIGTAIRRMGFARRDLLDLVRELPDLVLDWRPPLSAAARIDSWALEIRSIQGILNHIASGDRYYRTALQDEPVTPEPQEEIFDLALQRQRVINHLRSLTADDCARTFRPRRRLKSEAE